VRSSALTPIPGPVLGELRRKAMGLYVVLEAESMRRYGMRLEELEPEALEELAREKLGKRITLLRTILDAHPDDPAAKAIA
jgi:hypothetical protein